MNHLAHIREKTETHMPTHTLRLLFSAQKVWQILAMQIQIYTWPHI